MNLELEFRNIHGERPDIRSYCEQFPDLADVVAAAFKSRHDDITTVRPCQTNGQDSGSAVTSTGSTAMRAGGSPLADLHFVTRGEPGLPGYEVLGELGRGGMGVVLRARQVALNRAVGAQTDQVGIVCLGNRATAISE